MNAVTGNCSAVTIVISRIVVEVVVQVSRFGKKASDKFCNGKM